MKRLAILAAALIALAWLLRRALPHDGFEQLPNVDWTGW